MMDALEKIKAQGGEILCGGGKLDRPGHFVEPTLVKANSGMQIVQDETFAPILYIFEVEDLDEAIRLHSGEATTVLNAYRALPEEDLSALLEFLGSL